MSRDIFSPRPAAFDPTLVLADEAVFNEACGSGVVPVDWTSIVPSKDLITAQEVAELELQSAANFHATEWLSSIIWATCTRASIKASKSMYVPVHSLFTRRCFSHQTNWYHVTFP